MTFKKSLLFQCKHPFTSEKYIPIKIDMSSGKPRRQKSEPLFPTDADGEAILLTGSGEAWGGEGVYAVYLLDWPLRGFVGNWRKLEKESDSFQSPRLVPTRRALSIQE